MRFLTSFFAFFLVLSFAAQAQNLGVAPTKGAPNAVAAKQDISIKLDKSTGKIEILNKQQNTIITDNYQLNHFEIEIFDQKGEYAGSLELKDFIIPKNEVDKTENVKVAKLRLKHKASGEEMIFSHVDFDK